MMSNPEKENIPRESVAEREERVLVFWDKEHIFEQSLEQTKDKEPYVFYDGPPFATGLPHYGHLLAGTIKDVVPRYQTMRGRYVRREWGWDCHGLPIENLIEKDLNFKTKKDIEEYGVENFNARARESVLKYDKEWKTIVPRMGRWVDMEKAYKTMDASYTNSIWWAFKTLYDKKLIYEGFKSMHICPRCETTLAISEVGMNYRETKDISVYIKFELVDSPRTYLLAWTTTPWTLPGNVAIGVHPDLDYVYLRQENNDLLIVAKARLPHLTEKINLRGIEEKVVKGKDIVGLSYKPIFDYYANDPQLEFREQGWKVYPADFVTTETGTGVVHEAPAFGEEDMELAKKWKLPMIQHVGMDGKIKPEVKEFAGLSVKPKSDDDKIRLGTDIKILKHLQENGSFFAKENITHSYPYCWRCDTPLLNYAASSWFVDVNKMKPRLLEENREISWIPEHMGAGRFGKWLEGARDWAISRNRYWGAPLPVWKCNKCAHIDVFGGIKELSQKLESKNYYWVMRHGEAETNKKGIVSYKPNDPYPLTQKGIEQVSVGAQKIKKEGIELIIASPVLRTKETALLVAKELGLSESEILYDSRIGEVNTGDFNGSSIEEYRSYFTTTKEKFIKSSPNGETLHEMKIRIGDFIYEIEKKYKGKRILIVTHEYAVWMLDAVASGLNDDESAVIKEEGGEDYIETGVARKFEFATLPHNGAFELDFHRPFIDEQTSYHCTCELGVMERVHDVFDCWFESGSMPFAQIGFTGDERSAQGKLFAKNFPADFIAEGIDQTRGWFYTLLILSTGIFDRSPYKSVIVNGLILAEDGQKMSKKLKNYPDPMEIVSRFGADALRYYLISSPAVRGEELRFSLSGVDEIYKKIILRIDNIASFYDLYKGDSLIKRENFDSKKHLLDRWVLARWFEVHTEVTHFLDNHELDRAIRPIALFVDDLSTWYVRRSRDRFKDTGEDQVYARETLGWVLFSLARLLAPFIPFLAEDIYQRLNIEGKKISVHLESWPPIGVAPSSVLDEMAEARTLVSLALELRAKNAVKVRQPLSCLTISKKYAKWKEFASLSEIIAQEVNVHEVTMLDITDEILLDFTITPELMKEGVLRDLVREIQGMRKVAGYHPEDRINIFLLETDPFVPFLDEKKTQLLTAVGGIAIEKRHVASEGDEPRVVIERISVGA